LPAGVIIRPLLLAVVETAELLLTIPRLSALLHLSEQNEGMGREVRIHEWLFLALSGRRPNFCFRQEHRTFLSVNELHYLRWLGLSEQRFRLAKWSLCRG
jgi:hypothetical protein